MPNHAGDDLAPLAAFAGLEPGLLAGLRPALEPFAVDGGAHLFRQNDAADGLHVIARGKVAVQGRTLADGLVALAEAGPGDIVGELALVDQGRRSAAALALEATEGWFLARDRFERLLFLGDPAAAGLARHIRRLACRRTRSTIAALAGADPPPAELRAEPAAAAARARDAAGLAEMLAGLHQFSGFKPAEIAEVTAGAEALEAPRGGVLAGPGTAPSGVFVVLRGAVRTGIVRREGVEQLLVHGPGKLAGAVPALDGEAFATRLDVREDAVLLRLPRERLLAWEDDSSPAAIRLIDLVGKQITADLRALSRQQGRRRSLAALNGAGGTADV
jgi:CRP-like cAMP-binding protein